MLLRKVFSYGQILIGIRIRDRLPFVVGKDASSHLWCLLAKNQAYSLDFSSNRICFCRFYYSYYCKKSMEGTFIYSFSQLIVFRFLSEILIFGSLAPDPSYTNSMIRTFFYSFSIHYFFISTLLFVIYKL